VLFWSGNEKALFMARQSANERVQDLRDRLVSRFPPHPRVIPSQNFVNSIDSILQYQQPPQWTLKSLHLRAKTSPRRSAVCRLSLVGNSRLTALQVCSARLAPSASASSFFLRYTHTSSSTPLEPLSDRPARNTKMRSSGSRRCLSRSALESWW